MKNLVIGVLIIGGLMGGLLAYQASTAPKSGELDGFAACLAQEELTMYGAAWCSHCKKQKALFGDSFRLVPYVECPENQKLCLDKGIAGYPTWIDKNGEKYVGEQPLEKLGEITGCKLP